MLLTTSSSRLLTPIKMAFNARFKEVKKRTGCKSDNFYFSDLFRSKYSPFGIFHLTILNYSIFELFKLFHVYKITRNILY